MIHLYTPVSLIFIHLEFTWHMFIRETSWLKSAHCDEALMSFSYFVDNDDAILRCLPSSIAACIGVGN